MTKSNLKKVHSLTGRINMALMMTAWNNVKRNRGAAGQDGISIKMFGGDMLHLNLLALMRTLKTRDKYVSKQLKRVYIQKDNGKLRPLSIPSVRDRIAQEVIRLLIEPIFELNFSPFSFGFRPARNAHQAVQTILDSAKNGYNVVLDADIKGFFDNIPHKLIMDLLANRIADGNILSIIQRFLTAQIVDGNQVINPNIGTPQGGVISPLLANIVLDVLDQQLTQTQLDVKFVRYADDFVVLAKNHDDANQALDFVTDILNKQLKLQLAPDKTHIVPFAKGFDFLGFHINSWAVTVKDKSMKKFKNNIRKITIRSRNLGTHTFTKVNRIILGFRNYFATPSFATNLDQMQRLDAWIRARIRAMKFKRISNLDNFKLTNQKIEKLGLKSLANKA